MLVLPPFGQLSGVWGKATPTPTLHCTTGCHVDRSLVQAVWGKSAQPVDRRYYTIIAESRNVERAFRVNRPPWRRSDGFNLSAPGCRRSTTLERRVGRLELHEVVLRRIRCAKGRRGCGELGCGGAGAPSRAAADSAHSQALLNVTPTVIRKAIASSVAVTIRVVRGLGRLRLR